MTQFVEIEGYRVDGRLHEFIEREAAPGSGIVAGEFWRGLARILDEFAPESRALLARRAELQDRIDVWTRERSAASRDSAEQEAFLREIGYLVAEGPDFAIETDGVDPEIGRRAGPQLVVPVTNARYALNAANARWGSLYDALYGTDALPGPVPAHYDPDRGRAAVAWAKVLLDEVFPLERGSHAEVTQYRIAGGGLVAALGDDSAGLVDSCGFAGYRGEPDAPDAILLRANDLHVEVLIDPSHPVGAADAAGVRDILVEAALTTIMDFEDSVAVADAEDKVQAYRNWLGLMRGDLEARFEKNNRTVTRRLAEDRSYLTPEGAPFTLSGRSLLLVRNVGQLIESPTVKDRAGRDVPEGILDAAITSLIALHDIGREGGRRNSPAGSVYIVRPKMHGPDEVDHVDRLFGRIEDLLGLERGTLKLGIMDEERRTSVNLRECIRAARRRIAFINTGFLDRTGDEIRTLTELGPVPCKGEIKLAQWFDAYERRNVEIGLACGLPGRAQIGKGMWAAPDRMAAMLAEKGGHLAAGASTAWVPSPTAATLHATHYLKLSVADRQHEIAQAGRITPVTALLEAATLSRNELGEADIRREVERNAQSILGYVVRWVDQGVGCSKVPDLDDVGLMEDRATLRISSQHLANWLRHGVVSRELVEEELRRVAAVVDRQNAGDPDYRPMAPGFDGPAFEAARRLALEGHDQPSGYTEPILHAHRRAAKAAGA